MTTSNSGLEDLENGDRVRVTWSGREGRVIASHPHKLAGFRVLLDGEAEHWGFNRNELRRIESEDEA